MLQFAAGLALFLATGYFVYRALEKRAKLDPVEATIGGLAAAIGVPALVWVGANIFLGIPLNTASVYLVYVLLLVGCIIWLKPELVRRAK